MEGLAVDSRKFDALARAVAVGTTRRGAVRILGGGALASALSLPGLRGVGAQEPADARCRGAGERCKRDGQCCAERCINRQCTCKGTRGSCFIDRGCCSGRCRRNGKCR